MKSRRQLWFLVALVLVAGILQVILATRQSLWADEFFSLAMATGHSLEHRAADARPSLGDFVEPPTTVPASEFRRYLEHEQPAASPNRVIRAVALSDTSPPLYYLLLYGWTLMFGTSDLALRFFSILSSLASFPLLWAVAQRISGIRAAIVSLLLFALCPSLIYYSTEGRMYSLFLLATLATALASLLLQEKGARLLPLWIALSAAGFLLHYFFIFVWAGNVIFLFFQPGKLRRGWLIGSVIATGVVISPWLWIAAGSFTQWKVTQGWLNWKPTGFRRLHALKEQLSLFFTADGHKLWKTPGRSSRALLGLFTIAIALAVWQSRGQLVAGRRLLLWFWYLAAAAGPTAVDLLQHTYTAALPRYALGAIPAVCLLVGAALSEFKDRTIALLLGLILLGWSPSFFNVYRLKARNSEPVLQVARIVGQTAGASDLILVHSIPSGVTGFARYLQTPAALGSWVEQLGTRQAPASLLALAHGRSRVLLVKVHDIGSPAPEEDWLRAHADLLGEQRIDNITLLDFRAKEGKTF